MLSFYLLLWFYFFFIHFWLSSSNAKHMILSWFILRVISYRELQKTKYLPIPCLLHSSGPETLLSSYPGSPPEIWCLNYDYLHKISSNQMIFSQLKLKIMLMKTLPLFSKRISKIPLITTETIVFFSSSLALLINKSTAAARMHIPDWKALYLKSIRLFAFLD